MPNQDATPRKHTKFQMCDRHRAWFTGETRRRIAECFVEGGPAGVSGCQDGLCRLWPGTDLYVPEVCHAEMTLDWVRA